MIRISDTPVNQQADGRIAPALLFVREVQSKGGAFTVVGSDAEGAVVRRNDAFDYRQPQAGAGLFASVIAVEDFGQVLLRDTDTAVGDFEGQVVDLLVFRLLNEASHR